MNIRIKLWLKKRWKDLIFFTIIGLLFIPQVRQPLQVFIQGIFAGSPDEIESTKQKELSNFDWELKDLSGKSTNLSSSSRKVIIINSWATWCPPCIAEMPSLQSLYNDYKNKVDFYFVSNEKRNILKRWLKQKSYSLPVYRTMGPIPRQLNSNSLPTTYVINKKGKIVIQEVGAHDWNSDAFREKLNKMISTY